MSFLHFIHFEESTATILDLWLPVVVTEILRRCCLTLQYLDAYCRLFEVCWVHTLGLVATASSEGLQPGSTVVDVPGTPSQAVAGSAGFACWAYPEQGTCGLGGARFMRADIRVTNWRRRPLRSCGCRWTSTCARPKQQV